MAKRKYHQSVKDRMAESRGMERYETLEHYASRDVRRKAEDRDGGMLSEDMNAIANMPQEVRYHEWPKVQYNNDYDINDGIRGIDNQMRDDMSKEKKGRFPEKY